MLAVMENTRQVLDKFPCGVMMTGQRAISSSESLAMERLVMLYKLKYHQLTDILADWMVQASLPLLILSDKESEWKNYAGVVIVSLFGQTDYDQRKQAAEQTVWLGTSVVLPDAYHHDKVALI